MAKLKEISKIIVAEVKLEEERISRELEEGTDQSLKNLAQAKEKLYSCLGMFEQIKDELILVYRPIKEDPYKITSVTKNSLEEACNQAENNLKRVFDKIPGEELKLGVLEFKKDGIAVIHNRIHVAFSDCCRGKNRVQSIKLPKPRFDDADTSPTSSQRRRLQTI